MLSIVIPCRDEAENLERLIPDIKSELNLLEIKEFEILILNHGSIDNTTEILQKIMETENRILEFQYSRNNKRLGDVLLDGIRHTKGDMIITMDGDFSHQPNELKLFLDAFNEDFDFIVGVRYNKGQDPFEPKQRYDISKKFNKIARIVLRTGLSDYTSGYRCFKKTLFDKIDNTMRSKGFEIHMELNGKLSRIAENPTGVMIHYIKRSIGTSKLHYKSEFFGYLKAIYWSWKIKKNRKK